MLRTKEFLKKNDIKKFNVNKNSLFLHSKSF